MAHALENLNHFCDRAFFVAIILAMLSSLNLFPIILSDIFARVWPM
jgi:hypothetical protein